MLEVFKQCCFNRYFEQECAKAIKDGLVKVPTYLSQGSEFIPVVLKKALEDCGVKKANIFIQHRGHSYYLTFIGNPLGLAKELCGRPDGCNKGYGGSASIGNIDGDIKLFPHDGLLGSQVPIACGYAQGTNELTICVLGDAAAEEDYVLGAMGYAVTKKLPILFLCEDNGLSILTPTKERRSWNIRNVAEALGLHVLNLKLETRLVLIPLFLKPLIERAISGKPVLVNFHIERQNWHVGGGSDGIPSYDYLKDFRDEMIDEGPIEVIACVEQDAQEDAQKIWSMINCVKRNES